MSRGGRGGGGGLQKVTKIGYLGPLWWSALSHSAPTIQVQILQAIYIFSTKRGKYMIKKAGVGQSLKKDCVPVQ